MIAQLQHGDVTQLYFSTWKSRASGMAVNAFVCDGVLIDAGIPDRADALGAWVDAHPIDGAIITHSHEDHAGGVAALAARGIAVHCASDSEARLREDEDIGWYRRFCWGPRRRLELPLKPFASSRFELREARGHSADHYVVWDTETGTVFGGDLFVAVKIRVAHHDEDLHQQIHSLREVASWNPTRLFDAHRGLVENPRPLLLAKADWIERTVEAIETLGRQGLSPVSIRNRVLGREDRLGLVSRGEYSRLNFVRNVLGGVAAAHEATTGTPSA